MWLLSAAGAAWVADRNGYGEQFGLTFGMLLSVIGFLIVLVLPAKDGSKWKRDWGVPRPGCQGRRRPVPVSSLRVQRSGGAGRLR